MNSNREQWTTYVVYAGCLVRPTIRRLLKQADFIFDGDMSFYEEKGFLTSIFYIRGTYSALKQIRKNVEDLESKLSGA